MRTLLQDLRYAGRAAVLDPVSRESRKALLNDRRFSAFRATLRVASPLILCCHPEPVRLLCGWREGSAVRGCVSSARWSRFAVNESSHATRYAPDLFLFARCLRDVLQFTAVGKNGMCPGRTRACLGAFYRA